MSQDNTPPGRPRIAPKVSRRHRVGFRQAVFIVVVLSLFAVEPAAAQTNAVCSADNLPSIIEGFFQLPTALGIVGLAVVAGRLLIEMFTITADQSRDPFNWYGQTKLLGGGRSSRSPTAPSQPISYMTLH